MTGDTFTGEGILAITKALLENGVGYVGGYQGAPISHLMDVLADAEDLMAELGIRFEANANEAAAAAMLAASVHYPIRGAVTFKGAVGVNVASDALANLASSGVTGGALVILGEDYGEGSSIMQERSHAFAMKSQFWLLDPRPNLPCITKAVQDGFELSEASNTPVMLMVRIRSCHVTGSFQTRDNKRPKLSVKDALSNPQSDFARVVLPPMSFVHEQDKIKNRWPAAEKFIRDRGFERGLRPEIRPCRPDPARRHVQRCHPCAATAWPCRHLGQYPGPALCFERHLSPPLFGLPRLLRRQGSGPGDRGRPARVHRAAAFHLPLSRRIAGQNCAARCILPMAGEYTGQVMLDGITAFLKEAAPQMLPALVRAPNEDKPKIPDLTKTVPIRPPGFCTGCPERPIFAAMKLVQKETGKLQISADIGCHLFGSLPPFESRRCNHGLWSWPRRQRGL